VPRVKRAAEIRHDSLSTCRKRGAVTRLLHQARVTVPARRVTAASNCCALNGFTIQLWPLLLALGVSGVALPSVVHHQDLAFVLALDRPEHIDAIHVRHVDVAK